MSTFTDLEKDAASVDGFVNENGLIPTRRNGPKPSWQYLVDEIRKSRGFRVVGTFADGFTYELFNDVGIDADGNSWIYVGAGAPNKVVAAGTVPSVGTGYEQVTFNVDLFGMQFSQGGSITDLDQLVEDDNGNKWRWTGALNYTFSAGEDPNSVAGWERFFTNCPVKIFNPNDGFSAVENMISGSNEGGTIKINSGDVCFTGSSFWLCKASNPTSLLDFEPLGLTYLDDFDGTGGSDYSDALNLSLSTGLTITLTSKVYSYSSEFVPPTDSVLMFNNTTLNYVGVDPNKSAIRLSNSNITFTGKLTVKMADAVNANANRCFVLMGDWESGSPVEKFSFDELEFEGGHININGLAIAGASNAVTGNSVRCGNTSTIGRLVMMHWSNFTDHFKEGEIYKHNDNYSPTTHPSNVRIKEIISGSVTTPSDDFVNLLTVSAGYDVDIGTVSGSVSNPQSGQSNLVLITAGDLGFAYASTAIKNVKSRGINIGKVVGYSNKNAVRRVGLALYYNSDEIVKDRGEYLANIQDTYGIISARGVTSQIDTCLGGTNGNGSTSIKTLRSKSFRCALEYTNLNNDTTIFNVVAEDNTHQAIDISGYGSVASDFPEGLYIGNLTINGTGVLAGGVNSRKDGMQILKASNISVDRVVVNRLSPQNDGVVGTIKDDSSGVYIRYISVYDQYAASSAITLLSSSPHISVDHFYGPNGVTQVVSGGVTCRVNGRFKEYSYSSGNPPSGIDVSVGDRFKAANPIQGQYMEYVALSNGDSGTVTYKGFNLIE